MALGVQSSSGAVSVASPVSVINRNGAGAFVIACEHAANFIPPELNNLGIDELTRQSHVAWDLGALAVAKEISNLLDAPLVAQNVSRLVYDCNRPAGAIDAIAEKSEIYEIPGNKNLSSAQRDERRKKYYEPFRAELANIIETRIAASKEPTLITIHSFTPIYAGQIRTLDMGVIHDSDNRLADELINTANSHGVYDVRQNEPYGPKDDVTFTLVDQGISRGMLNVMIEIRNDLIADETSQKIIAGVLANYITAAIDSICKKTGMVNFPCCSTGN